MGVTLLGVTSLPSQGTPAEKEVNTVLDSFHEAAAKADGKTYFGLFAPEGVFLGTDATERWTVEEFRAYAAPHFAKGKGWSYEPKERHVIVDSNFAWFDELLENKSYGTCRGTGVLRKIDGAWRISQYHLTIPVPNALADRLVAMIRGSSAQP
jgi:hypothetical protein